MKLAVRVIPNARRTGFSGKRDGEVVLRLTSPALQGRANEAAVEFIADFFGISRSRVTLVSGEKTRHKVFDLAGLDSTQVEKLIGSGHEP